MHFDIKPIIITGGPGSGKSSLLDALKCEGFNCHLEVSRQIIIEQQTVNGTLMPWLNLSAFAEECYNRMLMIHSARSENITFCDRGVFDIIAYLKLGQICIDDKYFQTKRYYSAIAFICPPWKEIYVNDPQRPQSFDESVSIYHSIVTTYTQSGFELIEVPLDTIENRKNWIINKLDLLKMPSLQLPNLS